METNDRTYCIGKFCRYFLLAPYQAQDIQSQTHIRAQ